MHFIGALIHSVSLLPNYIGLVHRGISQLRFSTFQKEGDLFYWRQFTSTSMNSSVAEQFKKNNGTIFHINSLTGKDLSLYSVY